MTQWGLDPVFSGPRLPTDLPSLAAFPAAAATGSVTLAERDGATFNIAGHTPFYDPASDLWYCDIPINYGLAYTPFIRLALARFQPDALADAQASRVVLADFLQLAPQRSATVVITKPKRIDSISVAGPTYRTASGISGPGVAFATVEVRDKTIADAAIGWRPAGPRMPMERTLLEQGYGLWSLMNVKLPAGQCRLIIEQYEQIEDDGRSGVSLLAVPGLRLIYSDVIPLVLAPPAPPA